jgi:hypothetical protein
MPSGDIQKQLSIREKLMKEIPVLIGCAMEDGFYNHSTEAEQALEDTRNSRKRLEKLIDELWTSFQ